MAKTPAEKQKSYLKRLKSKDKEGYLKKERERKKRKLETMKLLEKEKYAAHLKNDRERKREKKEAQVILMGFATIAFYFGRCITLFN